MVRHSASRLLLLLLLALGGPMAAELEWKPHTLPLSTYNVSPPG